MDQFSAEDVKGIEVLYGSRYNSEYVIHYNPEIAANVAMDYWPAYIEITTWSGNGIFQGRKSGVYLYRPLPVTWPKTFYKPKYAAKNNTGLTDLRSTVLWEPNIITDNAGKAIVWFYAKSRATAYTVIIQGSDLNGSVGSSRVKINVK